MLTDEGVNTMASSQDDKRAQFRNSLKVNTSSNQQSKSSKQSQFSSNNASSSSSSSNKADAPDRQRSQSTGRGNER
jgi:hypothetical protein